MPPNAESARSHADDPPGNRNGDVSKFEIRYVPVFVFGIPLMNRTGPTIVLLPGMDGTGELFAPLLGAIPAGVKARVVSYPVDRALSYDALVGVVAESLAEEAGVVLVAESYSGPVALRYAGANPGRVRGVVLCASFVRPPVPRWLRWFVWPVLFRVRPPAVVVRRLMVGRDAPDSLVRAVREAVGTVRPPVLAGRLREVLAVDCADALGRCPAPVLWLVAGRDRLLRRSDAVIGGLPGVTVRTVDGPHLLLQREPGACWEVIAGFVERVGAGPAGGVPLGESC